jgi:DNA-binding SARP family transcriptional activator
MFDRFTSELLDHVGVADAPETIDRLVRRGVFLVEHGGGWYSIHPLVRDLVVRDDLDADARASLLRAAAGWFERNGHTTEMLRCTAALGDPSALAEALRLHGEALLRAGSLDTLVELLQRIPSELRTAELDVLEGEARHIRGDWHGALECYARVVPEGGRAPAGIAWRFGLVHHLRGELDEALEWYGNGDETGADPADIAMLRAWTGAAHWLRGDVKSARELAVEALLLAGIAGDDRAAAAAHTTLAMVAALEGDRRANDEHYLDALRHAERARDTFQIARIRTNRGSRCVEEGLYGEALVELGEALALCDLAGMAPVHVLAASNRGEALFHLGRFEEARRDLEHAVALAQRIGSRMVSYPLGHLGDVHRARGDLALARAAYEEAITVAERSGDLQGLVPALAGLALTIRDEEPELAAELAARAAAAGPVLGHAGALLACAWVAYTTGRTDEVRRYALDAGRVARSRRDRGSLAEALFVLALVDDDTTARGRLQEARGIWEMVGDAVGLARADLALARRAPSPDEGHATVGRALDAFRALGMRRAEAAALALVSELDERARPPIAVRVLGAFQVERVGRVIPRGEWQSRKARELLKLLVARRGRPLTRDAAVEQLWPDERAEKGSSRLSVTLSTLRAVLDPGKAFDAEHFVATDGAALWLRMEAVDVDAERFRIGAEHVLARAPRTRAEDLVDALGEVEAVYAGDFLEEDVYEDWTVAAREELRALYLRVAHLLAETLELVGELDRAARAFLRVLERDPYDEPAHLGVVRVLSRAGHHGEARRAYRLYSARMTEIGVEPAALPAR